MSSASTSAAPKRKTTHLQIDVALKPFPGDGTREHRMHLSLELHDEDAAAYVIYLLARRSAQTLDRRPEILIIPVATCGRRGGR